MSTAVPAPPAAQERLAREAADRYAAEGYAVEREPRPDDLPEWLRPFRPDVVARSAAENVVVKVANRTTLAGPSWLAELAGAVEARPGWRLELVVHADDGPGRTSVVAVERRAAEARRLLGAGQAEAALLVAWSAAEGALRLLAAGRGVAPRSPAPAGVLRELYSLDLLGERQFRLLDAAWRARSAVAHGFESEGPVDPGVVADLADLAARLVRPSYATVGEMVERFRADGEHSGRTPLLGVRAELAERYPEADEREIEEAAALLGSEATGDGGTAAEGLPGEGQEKADEPDASARRGGTDAAGGAVLDRLWAEYLSTRSEVARQQLVVHYSPLVKSVAGRVAGAGLPQGTERADLVSRGILGLLDAVDTFGPGRRRAEFEPYAAARIGEAIEQERRPPSASEPRRRPVRDEARALDEAYAELRARSGRPPTDADVAQHLGVTEPELGRVLAEVAAVGVVAVEDMLASRRGGHHDLDATSGTPGDEGEPATAFFGAEESRRLLAWAIDRLDGREKAALTLYYAEGRTSEEIGTALGISPKDAHELRTAAVGRLRASLGAYLPEPRRPRPRLGRRRG